eukprot:432659_1
MATLRKLLEDYTSDYLGVDRSTWTDFEYHADVESPNTIISTDLTLPVSVVTLYCIGIPLLQMIMKNRDPIPCKYILFIHNIVLSVLSLYLFLFMFSSALSYNTLSNKSYYYIFCALTKPEQRGTLNWCYYINLLVKYYELIDTFFLVIKKKKVSFLHGYHHPATLVFAYIVIMEAPGLEWTVLILNLLVHTIMYFYYGMSAIKIKMPGKIIITVLQIVQFVLDLSFIWYVWFNVTQGSKFCNGKTMTGIIATGILGSYLLLFLDFFKNTYVKKKIKDSNAIKQEKKKKIL